MLFSHHFAVKYIGWLHRLYTQPKSAKELACPNTRAYKNNARNINKKYRVLCR